MSATVAVSHRNQTLNGIAIGLTIAVGVFTIYYLYNQTKLVKLQIDKHEADKEKHIKQAADKKLNK